MIRCSYKSLMAKTDAENGECWLPLWMHLRDTAYIMEKLVIKWIPKATIKASSLCEDDFKRVALFVAFVHDIGKATSYFQSIITEKNLDKRNEIINQGYQINSAYISAGETPHAFAGQWILQSDTCKFGIREDIANIVGAHHGKPIQSVSLNGEDDLIKVYPVNFFGAENGREIWVNTWENILKDALCEADIKKIDSVPLLNVQAQVILSGLLVIADWIASNTALFPLININDYGENTDYKKRVKEAWDRFNAPQGWQPEIYRMDKEIFKERFNFYPNEVQKAMYETINECKFPGIFILEAQMGVGKTEAALSGAEVLATKNQDSGIFFGLPTQSTSNGLFNRLLEWAGKVSSQTLSSIRLAHNAAEFNEDYNKLLMQSHSLVDNIETTDNKKISEWGIEVHPWFQGNKKALLADFVLGTVDQFLMATLKRKHFMLRHIGLVGKVIVIDECHAYDTYMNQYLERSLQWMAAYGVSVILLSATLPSERRSSLVKKYAASYARCRLNISDRDKTKDAVNWEKINGYPILTWTDGDKVCQKVIEQKQTNKNIKIEKINSISEMTKMLDDKLQNGGCASIIVNTVKYAQEIYEYLNVNLKNVEIILYHAQFVMPDRAKKEKDLLSRMGKGSKEKERYRFILVGTQVLEQSLDYDADVMVTQLCPIDLLLQRIGRLQRHDRRRPDRLTEPICFLLGDEDGNAYDVGTKIIYGEFLLNRTEKILPKEIRIPEDIPKLVEKVYDKQDRLGMDENIYSKNLNEFINMQDEKKNKASAFLLNKPFDKSIKGMLINPKNDKTNNKDKLAEASVRDGDSAIEVILMKLGNDDKIHFVDSPAQTLDDSAFSIDYIPTNAEARKIAMQRLRLPHIFSASYNINKVIDELEKENMERFALWQQSPWLKGELILLLDSSQKTNLIGYQINYSYEKGLQYEGKEEYDSGKTI